MKTTTVVSLESHPYGMEIRKPGDEYECEDRHVEAMTVMGKIKLKDAAEPQTNKARHHRRDMRAAS